MLSRITKIYIFDKMLFIADDDLDEEEDDEKLSFDKTIMPESIILLDASDEFLRNRIMNLSEAMVSHVCYTVSYLLIAIPCSTLNCLFF